jgi:hypothetical protein
LAVGQPQHFSPLRLPKESNHLEAMWHQVK